MTRSDVCVLQEFTQALKLRSMRLHKHAVVDTSGPFSNPQQPHTMAAMAAIRNVLEHTEGDFTTLLSLEKFFSESSRHIDADFSGARVHLLAANTFAGGRHPVYHSLALLLILLLYFHMHATLEWPRLLWCVSSTASAWFSRGPQARSM